MWKRKKLILLPVLGVLLLAGTTAGVVMAQSGGSDGSAQSKQQALLDRIAAIYQQNTGVALDPEQLKIALNQAKSEMHDQALKDMLQKMVDNGSITQYQADQLVAWWAARPAVGVEGPVARAIGLGLLAGKMDSTKLESLLKNLVDKGVITKEQADAVSAWYQARPDVTLPAPQGKGFEGNGCGGGGKVGGRGMMGGRGFGGGGMMEGKGFKGGMMGGYAPSGTTGA